MELQPSSLNDKIIFERLFKKNPRDLAGYAFANVLIWKPLFSVLRARINGKLCIFFKDKTGCFMPVAPLGSLDLKTVKTCFGIMEEFNHNRDISRIENIEECDLGFFKKIGLRTYEKSKDYIVDQKEMAVLKGEKFKHKRNLFNFFVKNTRGIFRDYKPADRSEVLRLYQTWARGRASKNNDFVYQAMLEDSHKAFCEMLAHARGLGIHAKVVEIAGKIRAFSSGVAIHAKLFCINFEIADLSFKGLPQFIFCEFSKTLSRYPEINIMDDSGIENIRQTKLSYKPVRTVSSFTAVLGDKDS